MTLKETMQIMAILQVAYPNYYSGKSKEQGQAAAALWQELFSEEPAGIVGAAVKSFIAADTKGFPPAIGQIKEKVSLILRPKTRTELEAWGILSQAISRSAYYAKDEFAKLPDDIRELVHSPDMLHQWSQMEEGEVNTVVSSNFMRSYRERVRQDKELAALPEDVKALIGNMGENMRLKA